MNVEGSSNVEPFFLTCHGPQYRVLRMTRLTSTCVCATDLCPVCDALRDLFEPNGSTFDGQTIAAAPRRTTDRSRAQLGQHEHQHRRELRRIHLRKNCENRKEGMIEKRRQN